MWEWSIVAFILKLGTREVTVQFHVPTALPPRKEPPVPSAQEAGWDPEPVWK
jgi:hypothetical protein